MDNTAGHWELTGQYDRGIGELERRMSQTFTYLFYVEGSTMLSIDDDHLRLRGERMSNCVGLSNKANPRKAVGPVQTTVHDPVLRLYLSGRLSAKREGYVKSL